MDLHHVNNLSVGWARPLCPRSVPMFRFLVLSTEYDI